MDTHMLRLFLGSWTVVIVLGLIVLALRLNKAHMTAAVQFIFDYGWVPLALIVTGTFMYVVGYAMEVVYYGI